MARRPELEAFAAEHGLKIGSIEDLIRYRLATEHTVERVDERDIDTAHGPFRLVTYRDRAQPRPAFRAGARRARRRRAHAGARARQEPAVATCCTGSAPISASAPAEALAAIAAAGERRDGGAGRAA